MRIGASTAFIRILGDFPTERTLDSLQKLASLVALPEVGDSLGCLTLNTCKAFFGPGHVMNAHAAWLRDNLEQTLLPILKKMLHLRHVRCVVEAIGGVMNLGMYMKGHVSMAMDPMRVSRFYDQSYVRGGLARFPKLMRRHRFSSPSSQHQTDTERWNPSLSLLPPNTFTKTYHLPYHLYYTQI
jgi:hypothetical protein